MHETDTFSAIGIIKLFVSYIFKGKYRIYNLVNLNTVFLYYCTLEFVKTIQHKKFKYSK